MDFVNNLTKNDNNSNYDINEAISRLEIMHYIEQSDYLKLLSKYSKLNDVYLKLNSIEQEIGVSKTNKPIILIVIENLFINSKSNVKYDIDNNNISTMQQGFSNKNINNKRNIDNNNSDLEEENINDEEEEEESVVFFRNDDGTLLNPSHFVKGDFILINTETEK